MRESPPEVASTHDVEYVRLPMSTSGARYQSVTTSFEKVLTGMPNARARPKSASLSSPRLVMSKFCGLRSRSAGVSEYVTMPRTQHSVLVAEGGALEELIHEAANDVGRESAAIAVQVHVLLEVKVHVLRASKVVRDDLRTSKTRMSLFSLTA